LRCCRVLAGSAALVLTAVLSGCTTTTTASTAVSSDGPIGAAEPTVPPGQINGPGAAQTGGASVGRSCLVAAAGDVAGADDWRTGAARTARLIIARKPSRVLALGDLAYDRGSVNDFRRYYRPTWGAFKSKTLVTPGNHDYQTSGAAGLARYFGSSSLRDRGVNLCHGWRVVLLNSYRGNDHVDSGAVRRAARFLSADARRHRGRKLIAAWHVPRYSSGDEHGDDSTLAPLWRAAVRARVRIVLNAHDHHYERFAPVGPGHTVQLISGLGGHHMRGLRDHRARGSTVRFTRTPAVLFLNLGAHGYSWAERTVTGRVVDRGARS
jgi:acid phosphatase type 7